MTDDKVKPIGIRRKDPKPDICLVKKDQFGGCWHKRFTVDERSETVECRDCGEKLNPMWVLAKVANQENRAVSNIERYQEEMARLKKRSRTKCLNCGKMTPISGR